MYKTILILATLDTKGAEAGYIKELIEKSGNRALVMDVGIFGLPKALETEIKRMVDTTTAAAI